MKCGKEKATIFERFFTFREVILRYVINPSVNLIILVGVIATSPSILYAVKEYLTLTTISNTETCCYKGCSEDEQVN